MVARLWPLFVLAASIHCSHVTNHVYVRRSCRDHFLSGNDKSGILPIKFHRSEVNVECRMPFSSSLPATVSTVVHSALERGITVHDTRTVQWQISDFQILKDLLTKQHCRQTIAVNRTRSAEGDELQLQQNGVMLVSILGEQTYVAPHHDVGSVELTGRLAGILHIIPDAVGSEGLPHLKASELICEEPVLAHEQCLIDGGIQVEVSSSPHSHFRFSFRTDVSDQPLFIAHRMDGGKMLAELSSDFFIVVDSSPSPLRVGHLSDGKWHTLMLALDGTHFSVDGGDRINLPDHGSAIKSIIVKMNGLVMLTDEVNELEGCAEGSGRLFLDRQPSHSRPFCEGSSPCECTVLASLFTLLPSPVCVHEERDDDNGPGIAYFIYWLQFVRNSDLLSLLMVPDALTSSDPLRLSLTFKSDSDSGLLFFGEWRNITWGRLQVHFHGERMVAMHCTQEDENSVEQCIGCSLSRSGGFGTDSWTRVTLFDMEHEGKYMAVDGRICMLGDEHHFDTSEMYKTALARGSILFIGGMFNKKVRSGIYRDDFKAKFFENTREKLPSLRGCVKDVFSQGQRVDMLGAFQRQVQSTLYDPRDEAYTIKMGCGDCSVSCSPSVRCRPSTPSTDPPFTCDCSDIEEYTENSGICAPQDMPSLSMAASSLNAYRGEFSLPRQRGQLAKMWMKIRLPSVVISQDTTLAMFFSHGRRLAFRLFITAENKLALQVNPEDPQIFSANAEKEMNPFDDRIHLITIERRTPLGTHPSRRFFDLFIDGDRFEIPDPGMQLTGIEFSLLDLLPDEAGCINDLGLSFDFDEHNYLDDPLNRVHTLNVMREMVYEMGMMPSTGAEERTCGVLDPLFWTKNSPKTAPMGYLIEYSPNVFMGHSGGPLSSEWVLYSLLLTTALALLLILCLCLYFCCLRKRRRGRRRMSDDDRERIMRDSPDSYNVVMRRSVSDRDSCISDSIDRTDISAYDDVKVHKVKVDRESMISFLEPTNERPGQAYVVMRSPTPSDAPLVRINDLG